MEYKEYLAAQSKIKRIEEVGFKIVYPNYSGNGFDPNGTRFVLRADINSSLMKDFEFIEDNSIFTFYNVEEAFSFVQGWSEALRFSQLAKQTNKSK